MANKYKRNIKMKLKNVKQSPGVKTRLGSFKAKVVVADARQRIIQKKRKTVVDARDVLANIARKQDARSKLLKIREKNRGENVLNSDIRPIGSNILKKTDRNGKISLVTNKAKLSTDLNLAIQHQLGLITSRRAPLKKVTAKRTSAAPVAPKASSLPFVPPVIRKTILNDYSPPVQPLHPAYKYEQPNVYRWYRPNHSPLLSSDIEHRRQHLKYRDIITDGSGGEWRSFTSASNRPTSYVDLDAVDEEMPLVSTRLNISSRSNVHSRLDSTPPQAQTHGILAGTKTKVMVPIGHRIVVSNLQNGVTEDDIRELFEDIGQLLVARLVRPGTAEVIYKNLKDAQKAVDTYHNRQLDGQPMKCLLVNKRPINNPTAPAINPVAEGFLTTTRTASASSSANKLVPDLSTIHKVLFQRN